MTTGGGLAGRLPGLSGVGTTAVVVGGFPGGALEAAASRLRNPNTEVVQPVGVAVIDPCERLSITGGGGTRQLAIAVHLPIR